MLADAIGDRGEDRLHVAFRFGLCRLHRLLLVIALVAVSVPTGGVSAALADGHDGRGHDLARSSGDDGGGFEKHDATVSGD